MIQVARLHRFDNDAALKAFVDIVVNDAILIKGLRVIEGKKGLFVSMPKDQGKDKRWYDVVHPLTKEARDEISSVVLEAYSVE